MGVAVAVVCASASPAFADAAARYRKQLETFRAEVTQQAEADEAGLASDELTLLADWLDQAETFLKQGDTDAAGYQLKRVEYGLDLVRALVAASQIEAKAKEQEAAHAQASEQVAKLKNEVDELVAKKAELQKQLQSLR